MRGILLFVLVVLVCLLVGLTLACGLVALFNSIAPATGSLDYAVIMQALAR